MSHRSTAPWWSAALPAALTATAVEALLLQIRFRVFSGGFLNPVFLEGGAVPLFVVASLWLDLAVVALFVAPALWLTRGVRRPARRLAAAAILTWVPWAGCALQRLGVFAYARDWLGYRFDLGSGAASATVAVLLVLPLATVVWGARFVPDAWAARLARGSATRRRAVAAGVGLVLGAAAIVAGSGFADRGFQLQLLRKTSGAWIAAAGQLASDVDGDGYGLFRQPSDFALFDATRHPWAVDVPGNGVDENGVGGDLAAPGDFAADRFGPVAFARKPDVLLLVLETFPVANLTAEVDGRPVTPELRRLLAAGAVTGPAYTHCAYTVPSLTHLFTGSLRREATSIVDDFNANGYRTVCVSGQDESFGGLEHQTGVRRADAFVDARADVDERTSASADPGSLTVPWQVVVRNVLRQLETHGRGGGPVFAYVNLQDAHFPYVHRRTERILTDDLVTRGEMGRRHADRIRRTYLNAAANVDRAAGAILSAWTELRGRAPAFVIVADHGENIWENGMLGHGIALNRRQTRIAFLAGGFPVRCTFPIGLTDVRRLLRDGLTGPAAAPPPATDPAKWILQYTGSIGAPQKLGAATEGGGVVFDLLARRWSRWGEPPVPAPFPGLIERWEQIAYDRAQ